MSTHFDQYSDVIDSRDVLEQLGELESWSECDNCHETASIFVPRDGWTHDHSGDVYCGTGDGATASPNPLDKDESSELVELRSLVAQLRSVGEDSPEDGQTLVRDSYFVSYAQELAEECGYEISDEWPYRCIDWALAARELQMDYTPVEFYGVTYWVR